MNHKRVLFLSSLLAVTLAGCSGGKEAVKPIKLSPAKCVFPDAPKYEAPAWICDAPVEGIAVSAVGSHEQSAAGSAFIKEQAAAAARVNLAQQMQVYVTNMVKQYVETTGAAPSETVDKVNTSVSKLITAETLVGSRVYSSTTSPNGSIYVLVGLDPNVTREATENVLKSSMNHERALWQQFKAKNSQEELAADIARMKAEE